jgi:hypothetical protein
MAGHLLVVYIKAMYLMLKYMKQDCGKYKKILIWKTYELNLETGKDPENVQIVGQKKMPAKHLNA